MENENAAPLFSRKETGYLLFSVLSFSLIFFINRWRTTDFSYTTGLSYFLFAFICTAIITYIAILIQKKRGLALGYVVEYHNSAIFIVLGIAVTFLFLGYAIVLIPGFVILGLHPRLRLGHYRSDVHDRDIGFISLLFPITIFIITLFFLILSGLFHSPIFSEVVRIALPLALISFVPAPKNMGAGMYKWSRIIQFMAFFIILLTLIAVSSADPAIVLGTLIGGLILFVMTVLELLPRIFLGS
ncbi:MAG: hypothetical protein ABIJ21_01280 [Nanoarchaeota archaeon]